MSPLQRLREYERMKVAAEWLGRQLGLRRTGAPTALRSMRVARLSPDPQQLRLLDDAADWRRNLRNDPRRTSR